MSQISIQKLSNLGDLPLPYYGTKHSAGMDLMAAIGANDIVLRPMSKPILVPTGIAIALPIGHEAQVRPRSGIAKLGIIIPNAPGTIDADYRGEIKVLLMNLGDEDFVVSHGMRFAQLIISKFEQASWNIVESLDETERGQGGFGSTGVLSGVAS